MSSLSLLELEPLEDVPFAEPVEMPAWMAEEPPTEWFEPGHSCDCPACEEQARPRPAEPAVRWAVPGVWDDEPVPSPAVVGPDVAQLVTLIERIEAVDPTSLPPGQARAEADALHGVGQRLRVHLMTRSADVTARALHALDGHRSTAAWERTVAPDAHSGDRTLARRLRDLPHLAAAVRDGSVCVTSASKVSASLVELRKHLDRPDGLIDGQPGEDVLRPMAGNVVALICTDRMGLDETDPQRAALLQTLIGEAEQALEGATQHAQVERLFTLLARYLPASRLKGPLRQLELAILPSVLDEQDKAAEEARALQLRPNSDGTWDLHGTLTAEAGERLRTALGAEARRDPANPTDTLGWTDDEHQVTPRPDGSLRRPRNRAQRLHDALTLLLDRYLSTGLGGEQGKVPVQVTVTTTDALVSGAAGALPAISGSGRPLARSLLRRWWCDAHVTVLLLSRGHIPLGVVHSGRTLTPRERTASKAQFGNRCAGDGCCPGHPDDPLRPLIPHHVISYATAGRTSMGETLWACPTLHHDIHHGRLVRLRDGRLLTEHGWVAHARSRPSGPVRVAPQPESEEASLPSRLRTATRSASSVG